jgi:hypothetical protein
VGGRIVRFAVAPPLTDAPTTPDLSGIDAVVSPGE